MDCHRIRCSSGLPDYGLFWGPGRLVSCQKEPPRGTRRVHQGRSSELPPKLGHLLGCSDGAMALGARA
eukprot:10029114-Alexandrium_andersonii.AAC.1